MASQVSVVIPVLNEAESIGSVVSSMPWNYIAECIVVDNGSIDNTAEIATAAGARVIKSPRGYGAAMHAGTQAALLSSTIIVCMDGDGSDCIEDMQRLVGPIERDEADFVIGSRTRGKRDPGSMLSSQLFAAFFMGWLAKTVYGFRYTDMGPFRAIRRNSLEQLRMSEMTYGWNLEMQLKAITQGLRIREIPVNYKCRLAGKSKVSGDLKASIEAGWRIIRIFIRIRSGLSVNAANR
jgi:glycosyltransferase involved in cell wall biosynthesis